MLNWWQIGQASAIAAGSVFFCILVFSLPWRQPNSNRQTLGWVLGLGGGCFLGAFFLGVSLLWPPRVDQERYLLLLLPATLLLGCIGCIPRFPRWILWVGRFIISCSAGYILLYGSEYILNQFGEGWSYWEQRVWLSGLAGILLTNWMLLAPLTKRQDSRTLVVCLMAIALASTIAVMLSGYAVAYKIGFPLAAGLLGSFPALFISKSRFPDHAAGFFVVTLFTLLSTGYFFGSLSLTPALCFFFLPLLCWVSELPVVNVWGPLQRNGLRTFVVSVPLLFLVYLANNRFVEEPPVPDNEITSKEDPEKELDQNLIDAYRAYEAEMD